MDGVRAVDPDGMRKVANRLVEAADQADQVGASIPEHLDAGPLTPFLLDLVHEVAAGQVGMVMSLYRAADQLADAADRSEATEEANTDLGTRLLKELSDE